MSKVDNNQNDQVSRRSFLKMLGIGGAGVVIGASGAGSIFHLNRCSIHQRMKIKMHLSFMVVYKQVLQHRHKNCNFVALELKTKDKQAIKDMFKKWTQMSVNMTDGAPAEKDSQNALLPPVDTGESIGLGASKLTLTYGISKSFLKKIGMSSKIPSGFKDLPHFPNDQLDDEYSDGDIMIQACSNDPQVTFHAIHNLIRPFRDVVKMKWSQNGFVSGKLEETPRNLMAFKDGTVNPRKMTSLKSMSSLTMVGLKWNVLYYSTHSNPYRNMGPYIIRRARSYFRT